MSDLRKYIRTIISEIFEPKLDVLLIVPKQGDKHTNLQLTTNNKELYIKMKNLFGEIKKEFPDLNFFLQGDSSVGSYWLMFEPWSSDEDMILKSGEWLANKLGIPLDID